MIIIWLIEPAINKCPNLEYFTHSQFLKGKLILAAFIPSENIWNSLIPSLNPTATVKVKGCTSKLLGWSLVLNIICQASILSKLIEDTCSYLIAFILLSPESTNINFLVGSEQISKIFLVKSIEFKTVCTGDLKV